MYHNLKIIVIKRLYSIFRHHSRDWRYKWGGGGGTLLRNVSLPRMYKIRIYNLLPRIAEKEFEPLSIYIPYLYNFPTLRKLS